MQHFKICIATVYGMKLYRLPLQSVSLQASSGAQEVNAFPFLAAETGLFGINIEGQAVLDATYTKTKKTKALQYCQHCFIDK